MTVVGTMAGAGTGAAASHVLSAGSIGFASAAIPRCTTVGLTVTPLITGTTVSSVRVAGLPASCGGAELSVTAADATTTGSGSTAIPGGGGSVDVPLTGIASLVTAVRIDLVMLGP